MRIKKLSIIYIISFICSLLGCHDSSEIDDNDYFRFNQIGGLESLDPAFAKNLAIMWQVKFLYNTLIELDSNLQITPSIAKSYEISEDGLNYTFHLRNDVYFHEHQAFQNALNYRQLNAVDVIYSFNRLIDPALSSPGAWLFNGRVSDIEPFTLINDSTFSITLKEPFSPFIYLLTMPYCSIVAKEVVEYYGKDYRSHPIGTGPFKLTMWEEGNILLLTKNENYWEKDEQGNRLPYLSGIKTSFNETRAMEFLLLKDGKLDFINGIDGSIKDLVLNKNGQLKEINSDNIILIKKPYLNTEYLGINVDTNTDNQQNILHNPLLRKAIYHAIDRKKIVTYFRNGIGIPATGFIPSNMPGIIYDSNAIFNPNLSRSIVQKLSDSLNITIDIDISSPESHADMCNFIAQQLKDVGINAKVTVYQAGMLRQLMSQGQVKIFKAQWIADYPDAETYLAYCFGPMPAPPNYTRYNNSTYNTLYNKANHTVDNTIKYQLYDSLNDIITRDLPVIPLFYDEIIHFTSTNISNIESNALNLINVKRAKKKK